MCLISISTVSASQALFINSSVVAAFYYNNLNVTMDNENRFVSEEPINPVILFMQILVYEDSLPNSSLFLLDYLFNRILYIRSQRLWIRTTTVSWACFRGTIFFLETSKIYTCGFSFPGKRTKEMSNWNFPSLFRRSTKVMSGGGGGGVLMKKESRKSMRDFPTLEMGTERKEDGWRPIGA